MFVLFDAAPARVCDHSVSLDLRWDDSVHVAGGAKPRVAKLYARLKLLLRRSDGCRVASCSPAESGVATLDELPAKVKNNVSTEAHVLQVPRQVFVLQAKLEAHQVGQRLSVVWKCRSVIRCLGDPEDALEHIVPVNWEAGKITTHGCPVVEMHGLPHAAGMSQTTEHPLIG